MLELPEIRPFLSPGQDQAAVGVELDDPGVAASSSGGQSAT